MKVVFTEREIIEMLIEKVTKHLNLLTPPPYENCGVDINEDEIQIEVDLGEDV